MLLQRAYTVLDIKSIDSEQRIITGIATSASTDRVGDIVEPDGAEFKLPIPLLWQHDAKQPIGEVFSARVTKTGIEIKARIAKIEEPGQLKDRLDMAWQSIKSGLVKGLSIGFKSLEDAAIKGTYGIRFLKWLWLELSAVTIPANSDASILSIKAADVGLIEKGAIAPHSTATTDAPWDGPANKARLKAGDEKNWVKAFAWYDGKAPDPNGDGYPDAKSAFKFIHHMVSADGSVGAANLTACSSGIGVLNGGRTGTTIPDADLAGVHAHLARHLSDAGMKPPPLKSFDTGLAASGTEATVSSSSNPPVLSGTSRVITMRTDPNMPRKSFAEQIKSWEATRQANVARMDEILEASADTGTTLDEAQQVEHDRLESEVKGIDAQLVRLRAAEQREKDAVKPVSGNDSGEASRAREGRTPSIHLVERQLPPGMRFARFCMAKAAVRAGHVEIASEYIKQFFPDDHQLLEFTKTAVGAATTANAQGPLLQYTDITTEFIEFLRPLTILGKFGGPIPGGGGANYPDVTHVPFNVRVGTQTAGGAASWVGEGKPKPLTKGTFGTATLDFTKLACISVLTKEEVRFPSIGAQTKVRQDLTNAIIAKMDVDFIDPANLGTAGVKPAAITANIVATVASATTAVGFAVDLKNMLSTMIAAGIQPSSLVLIMSQAQALSLSLMRTSLGVRNYPDLTMMGGFLEGIPVITSEAVTSVGSPSTGMIVAVNARDVFLADDGNVTISTSDQASLQMDDAPGTQDGTTGTGMSLVSLWQTNMLGILAEREVNWKLMRAASVQYIASPAYVPQ